MSSKFKIDDRIEKLKDEWVKRGDSPFFFWYYYIRPYRSKGYIDYKTFLRELNWYGEVTYGIAEGIKRYMKKKI